MDYHVARNNEKLGVFAGAEAQARYRSGEILPADLVWCEGMPAWRPASEVFAAADPSDLPPPASHPVPPATSAVSARGAYAAGPLPPKPDNYLVWAILTTLLCCLPFGIVAIVFAAQVDSKYAAGDHAGAQIASGRAKLWSLLAAGSLLVFFALYLGVMVVFGVGMLSNLPR